MFLCNFIVFVLTKFFIETHLLPLRVLSKNSNIVSKYNRLRKDSVFKYFNCTKKRQQLLFKTNFLKPILLILNMDSYVKAEEKSVSKPCNWLTIDKIGHKWTVIKSPSTTRNAGHYIVPLIELKLTLLDKLLNVNRQILLSATFQKFLFNHFKTETLKEVLVILTFFIVIYV